MVKPAPASSFIVVETDLVFELLVVALDAPVVDELRQIGTFLGGLLDKVGLHFIFDIDGQAKLQVWPVELAALAFAEIVLSFRRGVS